MTTNEMIKYDQMVEYGVATAEELNLARNLVCGEWNEVLDSVCYVRTGYRTWEQYLESEMEAEQASPFQTGPRWLGAGRISSIPHQPGFCQAKSDRQYIQKFS